MEWYLPLIWAAVIGIAVVMYVLLDGFDLGIGILFPFTQNESERDQMTRSIAPYWDGNENQRAATRGSASGVHRLTTIIDASTAINNVLACARARSATGPSVFIASHVAPSKP